MVDAEFAVQYLVLSQASAHPELVGNVGNIALLQRAEQAGLLPAGVGQAAAGAASAADVCGSSLQRLGLLRADLLGGAAKAALARAVAGNGLVQRRFVEVRP